MTALLAILLALLIGLPIAEKATRWKVSAEYRRAVEDLNGASQTFTPVHTYKGYLADHSHPIEYRLLRAHTRSLSIVTGVWRRAQND